MRGADGLLGAVAEALASAPDLREALERTLTLVTERLDLQAGWVWLSDPDTGQFYSIASHGLPPYLREPVRMAGSVSCWCIDSFRAGKLGVRNVTVQGCSRLAAAATETERAATLGLRAHASVPLYLGERPLGILNVTASDDRELTRAELDLLAAVAHPVALAVERARLAEAAAGRARAEERARLAREIHDTLVQDLTGIGLQLEGVLNVLPPAAREQGEEADLTRARQRLERALALTRESLDEARRSVLNLRAAALDDRALPDALRALARRLTAETGIQAVVWVEPPGPGGAAYRLPPGVETELLRIAQEALTNIRRHAAGASEVAVRLRVSRGVILLSITDDGPGLPSSLGQRPGGGGQGIPGMRERARALGGTLRIGPRGDKSGVRIAARVPLPSADRDARSVTR